MTGACVQTRIAGRQHPVLALAGRQRWHTFHRFVTLALGRTLVATTSAGDEVQLFPHGQCLVQQQCSCMQLAVTLSSWGISERRQKATYRKLVQGPSFRRLCLERKAKDRKRKWQPPFVSLSHNHNPASAKSQQVKALGSPKSMPKSMPKIIT
jgi:hypothetical protein